MSVCRSFYRQHTLSWPVIHQELQRADGRPDHDADLPGEIVGAHPAQPKIGGCPQASRSNLSACEVGAASRGTGKAKEAPMAGSVNKAMQDGRNMVNMSVATSDTWRDRQSGERKERTEWHRVVIFNEKLAEVAQKYVKKGSKVYVEGQLSTRKWTDQSGQERYTTEVVIPRFGGALTMLDARGGGGGEAGAGAGAGADDDMAGSSAPSGGGGGGRPAARGKGELDDDIPF